MSRTSLFLALLVGLAGYLAVRLLTVTQFLPIFFDESIYLRWVDFIASEAAEGWLPLQDGKKPLFFWIVALLRPLSPDLLRLGRGLSIASGVCLAAVYTRHAASQSERWFAVLLLVALAFSPYQLLYDRLALPEGMLCLWTSLLPLLLLFQFRDDRPAYGAALLTGLAAALAFLTKTTALAHIGLPLLVLPLRHGRKCLGLLLLYVAPLVAGALLLVVSDVRPGFVGQNLWYFSNAVLLSPSRLLGLPFEVWWANLVAVFSHLAFLQSPLVLPAAMLGIVEALRRKRPAALLMVAHFSLGLAAIVFLTDTKHVSRYYLTLSPPLLYLACWYLAGKLETTRWSLLLTAVLVVLLTWPGLRYLTEVPDLPLQAASFRSEFREDFVGSNQAAVRDALNAFAAKAGGRVLVLVPFDWGLPTDGLYLELARLDPRLVLLPTWWHFYHGLPLLPARRLQPVRSTYHRDQVGELIDVATFSEVLVLRTASTSNSGSGPPAEGTRPLVSLRQGAPGTWLYLDRYQVEVLAELRREDRCLHYPQARAQSCDASGDGLATDEGVPYNGPTP